MKTDDMKKKTTQFPYDYNVQLIEVLWFFSIPLSIFELKKVLTKSFHRHGNGWSNSRKLWSCYAATTNGSAVDYWNDDDDAHDDATVRGVLTGL